MEEKRHAKRMEIDVRVFIKSIEIIGDEKTSTTHEIKVTNLSKGGIAFECDEELKADGFYDIEMIIWTKERIDTVIQIIRKDGNVYGGKFIGLPSSDAVKIQIYEMFNFPGENINK